MEQQVRQLAAVQPAERNRVVAEVKQAVETAMRLKPDDTTKRVVDTYRDRNLDKLVVTQ